MRQKSDMTEFQDFKVQKNPNYFGHFKHRVFANVPIWLKELPENSVAFFDECSHMGGALFHKNGFICKRHGWTYSELGENLIPKSPGLTRVEIIHEDSNQIVLRLKKKSHFETEKLDRPLKISVLSHACLLMEYEKKKILFDPWLTGQAYYGSWFLEPDSHINPEDLKVDAIIITHPHPDHFHLETLNSMDKSVPIFFPGFPSRIIEKGLESIGWKNLNSMPWDCEFEATENIFLRFLQPRSLWEDSATLLKVVKEKTYFTWLNLVDAGSVIDEYLIPDLDLLTSAFDQGASGYPLTWTQISEKNQIAILEEQRNQTVISLPTKSKKLRAQHFLPFAGHWRLGLPEHESYRDLIPHTSFEQLEESFENIAPDTKFLGLLPGDSYDFYSGATTENEKSNQVQKAHNIGSPEVSESKLTPDQIDDFSCYMNELIDLCEIYDSETVEFCVEVENTNYRESFLFGTKSKEKVVIEVTIPARIFIMLANRSANWDHVAIGYWGRWRRTPNTYPANFMRLLQVGIPDRYKIENRMGFDSGNQLLETSIAELLEKNPSEVTQLFTRAGLPCGACNLTNAETLGQAIKIHGVDLSSKSWFMRELAAASEFEESKLANINAPIEREEKV